MNVDKLLRFCASIDRFNVVVGQGVRWLVPVICIVTVAHGLSRRLFSIASNHVSEAQWYMFAAIFMIGAGYTLLRDEHVRIDIVSQYVSVRIRRWIEAVLHGIFIVPICAYLVWFTSGMFWISFLQNEGPPDVVIGLRRWVLIAFMPIGFTLLGLQSLSQGLKAILANIGIEPVSVIAEGLDLSSKEGVNP
jgi:TRAP-type mannitol/chloroaromatic compound transport system permease small subunit